MVKVTVGRCGAQGTRPSRKKAAGTLTSPSRRDTFLLPEAVKDMNSARNKKMTMSHANAKYRMCHTPLQGIHLEVLEMMEQGYRWLNQHLRERKTTAGKN